MYTNYIIINGHNLNLMQIFTHSHTVKTRAMAKVKKNYHENKTRGLKIKKN